VDVTQVVGQIRCVEGHQARRRTPGSSPPALAVALPDEDPVRPSLEAGRVAQLGKVAPDVDQGLLRRILGAVDVTQDPVRDGEEPVAHAHGQQREGLFIATLRTGHETRIHPTPHVGARIDVLSQGYGGRGAANGAVFGQSSAQAFEVRRSGRNGPVSAGVGGQSAPGLICGHELALPTGPTGANDHTG
jgi:hypothetical protein